MEEKNIQFKRIIGEKGNSIAITIPQEIQDYLNITLGDEIIISPQKGKKGLYVAIWKQSGENE